MKLKNENVRCELWDAIQKLINGDFVYLKSFVQNPIEFDEDETQEFQGCMNTIKEKLDEISETFYRNLEN